MRRGWSRGRGYSTTALQYFSNVILWDSLNTRLKCKILNWDVKRWQLIDLRIINVTTHIFHGWKRADWHVFADNEKCFRFFPLVALPHHLPCPHSPSLALSKLKIFWRQNTEKISFHISAAHPSGRFKKLWNNIWSNIFSHTKVSIARYGIVFKKTNLYPMWNAAMVLKITLCNF